MDPTAKDRFVASLLAGAMGDALGAPVEFLSLEKIRDRFGASGIQELETAYGVMGAITDDTQMALFTLEGLAEGATTHNVWQAYLRWMQTQGEPTVAKSEVSGAFGLVSEQRLHHRRAPGMTCLNALRISNGEPAKNESKGCGTVMRTAPYALLSTPEIAWQESLAGAALTHGHIEGQVSAGIMAVALWHLIRAGGIGGDEVRSATEHGLEMAIAHGHGSMLSVALTRKALETAPETPIEAFAADGSNGGWVAEEAWAMGLFAALRHPNDLKAALRFAVNHAGDSDSTGSIAGNLIGARHGKQILPADWVARLELADLIARCASETADLLLV